MKRDGLTIMINKLKRRIPLAIKKPVRKMMNFIKDIFVLCLIRLRLLKHQEMKMSNSVCLLDVSIDSDNLGDAIIMYWTKKVLMPMLKGYKVEYIATHTQPTAEQINDMFSAKVVFGCGSNLLKGDLRDKRMGGWYYDDRMIFTPNMCMLAVGCEFAKNTFYTNFVYKKLLGAGEWVQSVREHYSEWKIRSETGIKNVVNTGCITIWGSELDRTCSNIPREKGSDVVITVHARFDDVDSVKLMIKICQECYDRVYFWPQGNEDTEYLKSICDMRKIHILDRTLSSYDDLLQNRTIRLDYVGTRLHGAIHAMARERRSILIGMKGDMRMQGFEEDNNMPVIWADEIPIKLEKAIQQSWTTEIYVNRENVNYWLDNVVSNLKTNA